MTRTNDDPLEGLVVGAVPYLNVEPLVRGLSGFKSLRPSDLARALDGGEVDLATLPVGALVGRKDLVALPSCGIASDGPVRTVLLQPLDRVPISDNFCPDPASRTSNLLARLLLAQIRGKPIPPATESPLRVVIGDPAFSIDPKAALDMGAAWKEWTDLPFVFALWVAGPRLAEDSKRLLEVDSALRERAVSNLREVDKICQEQRVVPFETAREYLTEHIRHILDERFRNGADRFAAELERAGLATGGIRWAC